jgi:DNA modification methylase
MHKVIHGNCVDVLKSFEDNSVDSVVCDPPYGISFMGKKWDYNVPSVDVWRECLRVLKPGGHMLVACGTRTQHRMVVNIEDSGFEIRDIVTWLYGSGFPKSLDVSKAIDKEAGIEREVLSTVLRSDKRNGNFHGASEQRPPIDHAITAPATDAAKQWDGWGTALKPSCEFWTLCRKPLSESTVAKNVLRWGTGGINVDGCRVGNEMLPAIVSGVSCIGTFEGAEGNTTPERIGRFPANLILDETAAEVLNGQSGQEVSRFFYVAKASKKDRGEGNAHPTCKPTTLMAYLCRMVTPPGGTVLDPFAGSGSTGVGSLREGFSFIGIEREAEYIDIIERRLASAD